MVTGLQSISHFQKRCEHLMLPRSGGRFLGVSLGEPSGGRVLQRGCLGEDACVAEAEITANGGGGVGHCSQRLAQHQPGIPGLA